MIIGETGWNSLRSVSTDLLGDVIDLHANPHTGFRHSCIRLRTPAQEAGTSPQDMGSGVTGSLSASQVFRQAVGQLGQVPRVVAHHAISM
jgi:hypothetical protein